jgi:DNA-directed RNA polymerase specialized sigma24 family protein
MDIIALDDALKRLAAMDPQQSRIIELRFFGGLSIEETAEALKMSPATAKRNWAFARALAPSRDHLTAKLTCAWRILIYSENSGVSVLRTISDA